MPHRLETAAAATAQDGPMRHRPFALFWYARVASTIAYQMLAVAIGWQVYDLTGSAFDLGLVGLIQFAPVILMTLLIGHFADRYDRRLIVRSCQLLLAVASAMLVIASLSGWLNRELLFAAVLVIGAARAFELPTAHALIPSLVPPGAISRATAVWASANQAAAIVGPALGGVVYAISPVAVFGFCCASFLTAAVLVSAVRVERPDQQKPVLPPGSVFGGLQFIRSRPRLLGVITLDLFAVLLGGATALLPVYARDILHTGPWGLGLLRSAPAVGALLVSLVLARRPVERRIGGKLLVAVAVFGMATIVFALSTSFPLSLAALVILGASDAVSVILRFTLVQIETPDAMRGRVSAVNSMFVGTSNTLGEFESGAVASWLGAVPSVLIGGIGTVLIALIWMGAFPALRRIDRFKPAE